MDQHSSLFVGLDVSKLKIAVAVADGMRGGEVRFYGDIASDRTSVSAIVEKLASEELCSTFAMRLARPVTNFIAYLPRWATTVWWSAPSLIPSGPGERVKTNRRDAVSLARLHRAGELTAVWIPRSRA
jgi:hypothetical protein